MKRCLLLVLLIVFPCFLFGLQPAQKDNKRAIYTAHNIWFENPQKVYAINFKRGIMIPAGTRVYKINYTEGSPYYIQFNIDGFAKKFSVYISRRWQPGLKEKQLISRMFTYKNFEELTTGLSVEEIEMIKKGEVSVGMSKRAVEISYGFPPLHRTPSYEDNKNWVYWMSRNRVKYISFDNDWKVARISD